MNERVLLLQALVYLKSVYLLRKMACLGCHVAKGCNGSCCFLSVFNSQSHQTTNVPLEITIIEKV